MNLIDPRDQTDPADRADRADRVVPTTPDVCVVVADSSDDWVGGFESRDSDRPSGRDLPSGRCQIPGYRRPAACQNSFDPAPAHHERPEDRFGLPDRLLLDLLDPAKPACHWVCYRPLFQISLYVLTNRWAPRGLGACNPPRDTLPSRNRGRIRWS